MIKTIIIDFGDVFINLDKTATQQNLKRMQIEDLPEHIHSRNRDYEQGFVTSDEISNIYRTEFPQLQHTEFLNSWNSILLDFPKYRLEFLQKLKNKEDYQLILLSNTNQNHIENIQSRVPFYEDFKSCFDAFYLSHEIGMRKPDVEIFEFILRQHELRAEECLFIDDTPENTKAAASLGMHVWTLEPTREDVIDLFTAKKELF
ncbi:HAD family hydrolase [Christiangramia portivictoriae]|uniref:HAD family hydrolase n=1 Tax=Christiangramia portivictoriae TaxID=326069 RepID=UPI000427AFA6|nr:HAD family phosphatase [Christiangramia portivictoriae]